MTSPARGPTDIGTDDETMDVAADSQDTMRDITNSSSRKDGGGVARGKGPGQAAVAGSGTAGTAGAGSGSGAGTAGTTGITGQAGAGSAAQTLLPETAPRPSNTSTNAGFVSSELPLPSSSIGAPFSDAPMAGSNTGLSNARGRPQHDNNSNNTTSDPLFSGLSSQRSRLFSQPNSSSRGPIRRGDITPARARLLSRQVNLNGTPPSANRNNRQNNRLTSDLGGLSSLPPRLPSTDRPTGPGHLSTDALLHPNSQQTNPGDPQPVIWGTTVNIESVQSAFRDFLMRFTKAYKIEALLRLKEEADSAAAAAAAGDADASAAMDFVLPIDFTGIVRDSDRQPFYPNLLKQMRIAMKTSLNLDCTNLRVYGPTKELYIQLIRYPQEVIPILDHTLLEYWYELFEGEENMEPCGLLTVRPFNLERCVNLRDLDPADMDQLVTIRGLMIRCSAVIPDMKEGFFQCTSCDNPVVVENDRGRIIEPTACPREACNAKNTMRLVHNRCTFSDKQVGRMQETPDETPDGQTPYTVSLCMYDELVDVSKPGDRVEVTGIFRGIPVRVNDRRRAIKSLFKTYVDVVHVKKTDARRIGLDPSIIDQDDVEAGFVETDRADAERPEEDRIKELSKREGLYELLARSVAPSIFGMDDVKKGALLQLFGGTNKFQGSQAGSPRIRGDINILIVGDPGVSKSQLLKYVHQLAPRGIYTSGKGSSAVGLTAYVTRDPDTRQLVLESGALVLSDGGVCCIDEFDKMSDHTRSVLHEVMEQQTISVAKAGIITTLNARTSILACANPINSKFDEKLSVVENVNLPPPLVSRFDLLFLLLDRPNQDDDRMLAKFLVGLYMSDTDRPSRDLLEIVPIDLFTKYISYARQYVKPEITVEAGDKLVEFYMRMRGQGGHGASRDKVVTATTRQLESMIRLSEGHAKMRLSATVEVTDVEEAHRLMVTALQESATDPKTGRLDMDLLQTGITSRHRLMQSGMKQAVEEFFVKLGVPTVRFRVAFARFKEQSKAVSEDEFFRVVQEIGNDDHSELIVTGQSKKNCVITCKT